MKVLSLTLVLVIIACAALIGYLLLYIPYECRNHAISSSGTATCGLEHGAYVIAVVLGIVAVSAAALLVREMRAEGA
jgi:hypothetical protein